MIFLYIYVVHQLMKYLHLHYPNIFDLYGWNALKGQKLLAQGNALGIKAISKSPCKGKSFTNCPWSFKAFALTGRQVCEHANPGRCPGLRASALSGRAACGRCPWAMNFWASGRVALCLSGHANFSNFPSNFSNFLKKNFLSKKLRK